MQGEEGEGGGGGPSRTSGDEIGIIPHPLTTLPQSRLDFWITQDPIQGFPELVRRILRHGEVILALACMLHDSLQGTASYTSITPAWRLSHP